MAVLEVFAKHAITIYETSDAGKGVVLGIEPLPPANDLVHKERFLLKFGNRLLGEVSDKFDDPMNLEIGQALSAVGELAGWDRVTLNGSTIWESAAVRAAKAELAKAKKKAKEEAAKKAAEAAEKEAEKKDEKA